MSNVPKTSISMLTAISEDSESVRWNEFFLAYEGPMRGFLKSRYPTVDADDVIQETLVALTAALPGYHYTPDEKGHFRNYLMGILAHKAIDHIRKNVRRENLTTRYSHETPAATEPYRTLEREDETWQATILETAIEQLMSDTRIQPPTREIFKRVALQHEKPEAVAAVFGVPRNTVDQIKRRMIARLADMVRTMRVNAS